MIFIALRNFTQQLSLGNLLIMVRNILLLMGCVLLVGLRLMIQRGRGVLVILYSDALEDTQDKLKKAGGCYRERYF
ncbi:MAG: hypothetical protein ACI9VM_000116 [Candidatus Azotimanducaceae bacterium]|jgi:hypothetical protein